MKQRVGQRALRGMSVTLLATLVTSACGLLVQIVLGKYLPKEDFAWYAIALSWAAFAMAIRNGGTQQILIRSGDRFSEQVPPIARLTLRFNIALFVAVLLVGVALAAYHQNWIVAVLMACIGLYVPLSTYSPIFQARLAIDGKFGALAWINSASAMARAAAAIGLAFAGFGALSLALPFIVVAIVEVWMGARASALKIESRAAAPQERREIVSQARWIVLGALAVALVMNGDYLAIGLFGDAHALADYFFGFQLTAAVAALLTGGLQTVMLPTFVALGDDVERQLQGFSRASATLMIVSVGGCFLVALLAEPLIHWVWDGKWDSAVIVVQVMALTLPLRLLMPLGRALLESRGLWHVTAPLTFADGVGIFSAAAVGAWMGGAAEIAIAVGVYRVLSALVHYCITRSRLEMLSLRRIWRQILMPIACGIAALAVAMLVQSASGGALGWVASIATFAIVYVAASALLLREDCAYLFAILRSAGLAARV